MYGFWETILRRHLSMSGWSTHAPNQITGVLLLLHVYRQHEQKKRRQYKQRVHEVEHATFTPLVMSATAGMGRAAITFYKRLASMISDKKNTDYSQMVNWIHSMQSFVLLRASTMSIRGAKSSGHYEAAKITQGPIDLNWRKDRFTELRFYFIALYISLFLPITCMIATMTTCVFLLSIELEVISQASCTIKTSCYWVAIVYDLPKAALAIGL